MEAVQTTIAIAMALPTPVAAPVDWNPLLT
jgi:hypothetical protein